MQDQPLLAARVPDGEVAADPVAGLALALKLDPGASPFVDVIGIRSGAAVAEAFRSLGARIKRTSATKARAFDERI